MKRFRFIPVLAAAVLGGPVVSQADTIDGIKVVVNDKVITFAEVREYARDSASALQQQYGAQPDLFREKLNGLLNDAMEQLVENQLILHSFDAEGYKLPESAMDEIVQDRIKEQFGDRVTLMRTLQARGMTFEQYRQQIRDQYISSALRHQNIQRELVISPAKIVNYYHAHEADYKVGDEVKLRMIVLSKTSPQDDKAQALARELQAKLKAGAGFAELASTYSQGSQQRQGGDWGWVERSVLRKELADIAFSLAPGQVSDAIDTRDALYLMLVEDKRIAHVKALSEVRAEIEKTLRVQEQARLQKRWIDGLQKKTFIRYIEY